MKTKALVLFAMFFGCKDFNLEEKFFACSTDADCVGGTICHPQAKVCVKPEADVLGLLDLSSAEEIQPDIVEEPQFIDVIDIKETFNPCLGKSKGFGCPCVSNDECESGVCVEIDDGKICTYPCVNKCPEDYSCFMVTSGTEVAYICLQRFSKLCQPCMKSEDCEAKGEEGKSICVDYGDSGSFCGVFCEKDEDCPNDYECKEVETGKDTKLKQCKKKEGECKCNLLGKKMEMKTICKKTNQFGQCTAERKCTKDGLTLCDAKTPEKEKCDLNDNDCNGKVDDGLDDPKEAGCLDVGICKDKSNLVSAKCQNGNWICDYSDIPEWEPEEKTCDGLDNDCDGQTDEDLGETTCGKGACTVTVPNCIDGKLNECIPKEPGEEECDGVDNDCDGDTDEDLGETTCGIGECKVTVPNCMDGKTVECIEKQPMEEVCDGLDNDCDGDTDEDLGLSECGEGECHHVVENCVNGKPNICDPMEGAVLESCDLKDNDCDGQTDEEDANGCVTYGYDNDGDGYWDPSIPKRCLCSPNEGFSALKGVDCDDSDEYVNPSVKEICNGKDDNCDGNIDEVGALGCNTYWIDEDNDTYGNDLKAKKCLCKPDPDSYYTALKGGDCNDKNQSINPDAKESCNGVDDNCDGLTDGEDSLGCTKFFADKDYDGHGVYGDSKCLCTKVFPYSTTAFGDCDDEDPEIHPLAQEKCNDKDDNCNGVVDDPGTPGCSNFLLDADGDGFGVTGNTKCLCKPDGQYSATQGGDCDDSDPKIRPNALEICNERDDNCDNITDPEGSIGCEKYYEDADQDGYGNTLSFKCLCGPMGQFSTKLSNDCDDTKNDVNPGMAENCMTAFDDNCDGTKDSKDALNCITFYYDGDGDGYGTDESECWCQPNGFYKAIKNGDCNDFDKDINPSVKEKCNKKDDNCDGKINEGPVCDDGNPMTEDRCVIEEERCYFDMPMVDVPGGSFMMGCNEEPCDIFEIPYHQVNMPAFKIDKYEVTVLAYKTCVEAGVCTEPLSYSSSDPVQFFCNWNNSSRVNHPVNCITWAQAKAYCEWAGKRLCTEAEWEKAARGTDERVFPWGNQSASCTYAIMCDDISCNDDDPNNDNFMKFGCGTIPFTTWQVGSKVLGASPYGALDMAGNVWEWVEDRFHSTYEGAPTDGSAWLDEEYPYGEYRVLRGGGFFNGISAMKTYSRGANTISAKPNGAGVRCCK